MPDSVEERVISTVARLKKMEPEQITVDTTFEELGMDSLDGLSLIFELEEEFNVAIPNEEAVQLRDVRHAVESLKKLLAKSGEEGGAAGEPAAAN